jgi:hypothetical protein
MPRTPEVGEGNPSKQTLRKQGFFLKAYARSGTKSKAARTVGISYQTVMDWRRGDLIFLEKMQDAESEYNDSLDEILTDLIQEMHDKLDYKANPTLLIFKMKGAMPWKYNDFTQTTTGARDILAEFRKAMTEARSKPAPKPGPEVEEKSALDQAREILQSKFGSFDDADGS